MLHFNVKFFVDDINIQFEVDLCEKKVTNENINVNQDKLAIIEKTKNYLEKLIIEYGYIEKEEIF